MTDPCTICFLCPTPISGEPSRARGEPAHRDCVREYYGDRRAKLDPFEGIVLVAIVAALIVGGITAGWLL